MQFKRMLLMCSALITLAYSFPTDTQKNITTTHQSDTNQSNAKENERPLVLIMEEKDPKSDSVIVQFVYTNNGGNSIVQKTGKDTDKYVIENPIQEEKKNKKSSENDERKLVQVPIAQKASQRYEGKPDTSKVQISPLTSLAPEEQLPFSFKWPKYYNNFNPVKPFPELENQKSNQIVTGKIKVNDEPYISNNGKEREDISYVAGPPLNPLSIYDRELPYVPIFD